MRHYVNINDQVFSQLLLSSFDAFVVGQPGKKKSGLEVYASLYGVTEFTLTTMHHRIDYISTDTSANMGRNSVAFDLNTQALKEHLAEAIGSKCLGNMHSHPYIKGEITLDQTRAYGQDFSQNDLDCTKEALKSGRDYQLEVIITIHLMDKLNNRKDGHLENKVNVFEFTVGNCKCFIRAQVFSLNDSDELVYEKTILKCEYIQKFKHYFANFGRVKECPEDDGRLIYEPLSD